ncbi:hypothetical protein C8R43DRAFT_1136274 [Mycena crocata]|nr:hypothetical protein C8R43DRAFT_1136274 [Mycena crocata]
MSSTLHYVTTSPPFLLRRFLSSQRPSAAPPSHSLSRPARVRTRLACPPRSTSPLHADSHSAPSAPRLPRTHLRTCSRPLRCIGAFAVCCAWAATTPARSNPRRQERDNCPFSRQDTPDLSGEETHDSARAPKSQCFKTTKQRRNSGVW